MTIPEDSTVIEDRTDGHAFPIARKIHGLTRSITSILSVDIITELNPRRSAPLVNTNMATFDAISIIVRGTNGNDIAVITKSYREAREIVGCFAVNIFAELFPISCVG